MTRNTGKPLRPLMILVLAAFGTTAALAAALAQGPAAP